MPPRGNPDPTPSASPGSGSPKRRSALLALAVVTLGAGGVFLANRPPASGPGGAAEIAAQTQELATNLGELQSLRGQIEEIEAKTRAAFTEYARNSASRASGELPKLQRELSQAQTEVAAILEASTADLDRFVAMRSNASFDRLAAAHDLVDKRLTEIGKLQEQVLGILSLCAGSQAAAETQQAAAEAQGRIADALKQLEEARGIARGSRQRTAEEHQYEHFTYHLARAERRIAEKPGELSELGQRQEAIAGMISDLERAITTGSPEDRPRLESQLAVLRTESDSVTDKIKSAEKQLADARKNLEKLEARVAEVEATLTKQPQPATEADRNLSTLQAALVESQRAAAKLQAAAVAASPHGTIQALPEAELLAALGDKEKAGTASAASAGLPQAMDEGAAIATAFHRVRAMELAMERGIPLKAAFAMTGLAQASRGTASKGPELEQACAQTRAMLVSSRAMLAQAQGGDRTVSAPEEAGSTERIKDLTGRPGPEILLPGGPGGPPLLPEPGKLPALSAHAGALPAGLGPARPWVFVDHWQVLGPFDNPRRENIESRFPPETVVDPEGVYSGKNGVPLRWETCASTTPNTLPPFRAYNEAHRIDGLTDETSYLFNLQYTVYYACAEVSLEKEADLWLAIGSDDYSKIWVNDRLVWSGGKGSKPWRADEGYRKVPFRAGLNRILYRVENGNDRTEFSLLLGSAAGQ